MQPLSKAEGSRRVDEPKVDSLGAYGLRVEGVSGAVRRLLGPAAPSWETIELRARIGRTDDEVYFADHSRARVPLPQGGEIVIDRSPFVAEVRLPERAPRDEELLHPYLAYVAGMVAWWLRRECVHAGSFVLEGGVWAFVGAREAGKSSTLGWLAMQGYDIVCDDILVIQNGRALAGPRFVDLRAETAALLGAGTPIGQAGARKRWRLEVGPVPAELPLRGWIFLDWGPEIELKRAPATQCLLTIKDNLSLFGVPTDPPGLLDLASLPGWHLRRPRGWESVEEATRRLLDALAS